MQLAKRPRVRKLERTNGQQRVSGTSGRPVRPADRFDPMKEAAKPQWGGAGDETAETHQLMEYTATKWERLVPPKTRLVRNRWSDECGELLTDLALPQRQPCHKLHSPGVETEQIQLALSADRIQEFVEVGLIDADHHPVRRCANEEGYHGPVYGVFGRKNIQPGTVLGEYVGVVRRANDVTADEHMQVLESRTWVNTAYSFDLHLYDENDSEESEMALAAGYNWDNPPTLDASKERNELAYINDYRVDIDSGCSDADAQRDPVTGRKRAANVTVIRVVDERGKKLLSRFCAHY
eukprot:SAG31_NODE_4753_length_2977_cov_2.510076_3_plen_294_part_00